MISTIAQGPGGDFVLWKGKLIIERRPHVVASTKIRNRLRIWLGECFADVRIGVPYIQKILVKNPDMALVRRIFTDVILSMRPIIVSVDRLELSLDNSRLGQLYFEATADNGQIVTGGFDGPPFIV